MAEDSIAQQEDLPAVPPPTSVLGLQRWVQFAFIAGALALFWLFDHVIIAIWEVFADSDSTLASAGAAILAIVVSSALYRSPKVSKFANEVAEELARVKWPTREETWNQTMIVLVVSVVAAIILGVFDATWSKLSDLVYQI